MNRNPQTEMQGINENARLIAAAPELLAACKAAREWMATQATATDYANNVRTELNAAIAKVEGSAQ